MYAWKKKKLKISQLRCYNGSCLKIRLKTCPTFNRYFILRSAVNRFTSFYKRKILYLHVRPSPRGDVSKQGTIWNLDVIYSLSEKRRSARPNGIYF